MVCTGLRKSEWRAPITAQIDRRACYGPPSGPAPACLSSPSVVVLTARIASPRTAQLPAARQSCGAPRRIPLTWHRAKTFAAAPCANSCKKIRAFWRNRGGVHDRLSLSTASLNWDTWVPLGVTLCRHLEVQPARATTSFEHSIHAPTPLGAFCSIHKHIWTSLSGHARNRRSLDQDLANAHLISAYTFGDFSTLCAVALHRLFGDAEHAQ